MTIDGISIQFAADLSSLLAGVQEVISSVESVAESASAADELGASFQEASSMAEELTSAVAGIAEAGSAVADVAASTSELDASLSEAVSGAQGAATEISSSISEIATSASDTASQVQSDMAEVSSSIEGIATTASDTVAQVQESMSGIGTSAQTAADETSQAGQTGGTGFFSGISDGLSKAGMQFMAIQAGVNMVQGAFQQATGPFGNFQQQMTQLQTGAGELQGNMAKVSSGIEQMSVQTGTSTDQLSAGMYMIESAGFHGADGLKVLQDAAEGSQVGAANLADVANALTSDLNAYGQTSKSAAGDMNQLIATVAAGKMHMSDLATALSAVLPVAAAAHISYSQIGGAIATMTAQGTSAQQATQDLANTIRSLQNPNNVAITEMQQLGLNSNNVATQLGKKGLTGTLQELQQAILTHMGPAGTVLMSAFKNSTTAAQDAKIMMGSMPASLQHLAQSYLNGSLSAKQWRVDLQAQPPMLQKLMQQFAATADKTHSFNTLLTAGGPAAQTYTAAMAKMLGGSTGLNVALQLTGTHMSTFEQNVQHIAEAGKKGGNSIQGWSLVQQNFNTKMAHAAAAANVMWINIGEKLAPVILILMADVGKAATVIGHFFTFLAGGSVGATAIKAALIGIAVALGAYLIPLMITAGITAVTSLAAWAVAQIPVIIGTLAIAAPYILIGALVALVVFGIIEAIQHWGAITKWLTGAWSTVKTFFSGLWADITAIFVGTWNAIVAFLKQVWSDILAAVKFGAEALFIMITGPTGMLVLFIVSHWTQIKQFLAEAWADIVSTAKTLWSDVTGVFSNAWSGISNALHGLWTHVTAFFSQLPGQMLTWGQDMIQNLINGILNMAGNVTNAVSNIAGTIAKFLHFSKPDAGPLADVDQWMPDFGDLLARDLAAQQGKFQAAVGVAIAPIAAIGSIAPTSAIGGAQASLQGNRAGASNGSPQIINVNLDGEVLAQALGNTQQKMITMRTGVTTP